MGGVRPAGHRGLRYLAFAAACGVAAGLAGATPAGAQTAGYTASFYVARATYPGQQLTGTYLFNSVDVARGPVRVSASVPFIHQRLTFTEVTIDPAGGTPLPDEDTSTGFGDPVVRLDVRLVDDRKRGLQIAFAASVKPSIVDAANGLGTGVTDVAAGGSVFMTVGPTSVFADVLFWKYGDPEGLNFQDTLSYSVGVGRRIGTSRISALASLAGFSKGIEGAAAPLQLSVAMLALVGGRQSIAITASVGLNDESGDFSIGTSWRIAR